MFVLNISSLYELIDYRVYIDPLHRCVLALLVYTWYLGLGKQLVHMNTHHGSKVNITQYYLSQLKI